MTTPKQSLNKAFLKLPSDRTEIDTFKSNPRTPLNYIDQSTNANETEENLKTHIRDFLMGTYYNNLPEINTYELIDLVIHNGSQNTTSIGMKLKLKSLSKINHSIILKSDSITTRFLNL